MAKSTRDVRGVQVKVRPENVIYNVPMEKAKEMVPFEPRSATMKKRIDFLSKAISVLEKVAKTDEKDEKIVKEAIETIVNQTVIALDDEYELKPSGVKKSLDEHFGNRFIKFCGINKKEPEMWGSSDAFDVRAYNDKHDVETIEINASDAHPQNVGLVKLFKRKAADIEEQNKKNRKFEELYNKRIRKDKVNMNPDLTDELKSDPPKPISRASLINETCMSIDPFDEKDAKDMIFESLQQNIDKKYKAAAGKMHQNWMRDKKGRFASKSTGRKGGAKKVKPAAIKAEEVREKFKRERQKEEEIHKKYCEKIDKYFKQEKEKLEKKTSRKKNG